MRRVVASLAVLLPTLALATDCRLPASDCTLRAVAAQAGVHVGAAAKPALLASDPDYAPTLAREFDSVTAENEMKWALLQPAPGVWAFGPADALVAFADSNGMRVRGHNLVWDQALVDSTPAYVTGVTDPAALRAMLAEHVGTVVGHFRGRVDAWDVVNEPLETLGSALYDNVFHRLLGPGYIAEALHLAHAADPGALLFVNEVLVETAGPKFQALLALARDLRAAGAPLHGIGLQGHFFGGPRPAELRANIEALAALGLVVELTEVDIPLRGDGDVARRLERQRQDYRDVAGACMAVAACRRITTWGFTDRYTWLDAFLGPGLAPLPLDVDYGRKPAWTGLRDGLLARVNASPLAGRTLLLRAKGAAPRARRLRVRSQDPSTDLGTGPGGADDPVLRGGTLRVTGAGGQAFDTTYVLPAEGWRYARASRPEDGYVFVDPTRTGVHRVRVVPGGGLEITGAGAGLGHDLATDPGPVDVALTLGARRYCLRFGGTAVFTPGRRFRAVTAPPPTTCDAP